MAKAILIKVILPFSSHAFDKAWEEWLTYRKEIKKSYKSTKGPKALLEFLSTYPEEIAIAMIEQSIRNEYQGVFELKQGFTKPSKIDAMTSEAHKGRELLKQMQQNERSSGK